MGTNRAAAGLEAAREKGTIMNSSAHLAVSESTARRVRKPKAHKRGRPRSRSASSTHRANADRETTMAAVGTLTRTKTLLLAALRVWELKHRVGE